ncbi:MAG: SDR family oxidoreductase [Trueperella sp.]|nr:SDR family oxidoreductase [Trueperella sp.]
MALAAAKTILLTGASRGIGARLARELSRSGRTLLLTARRRESLYGTARACTERGAQIYTYGVELSEPESVAQLIADIGEHSVDMLVNNAGVFGEEADPWQTDPELWWQTQEVNLRAPYLLQHALVPEMLARGGGRIVDLSSGAAVWDSAEASGYYVAKTALLRLAGSLHEAGYARGLRVFSVAPGVVKTDMTAAMRAHDNRTEWNEPSEVAEIIAAIADGELDGIAGTQVRAGTDSVARLREISARGVAESERKLRLTPWQD